MRFTHSHSSAPMDEDASIELTFDDDMNGVLSHSIKPPVLAEDSIYIYCSNSKICPVYPSSGRLIIW
jgi:hypothetical protein